MPRTTQRESCSEDEDWQNTIDTRERRKIQNRNNQRAFRRRRLHVRQNEHANAKIVQSVWPTLLPKASLSSSKASVTLTPTDSPVSEVKKDNLCGFTPQTINAFDTLFNFRATTGLDLDANALRVFEFASKTLWASLNQIVLGTTDSVGTAMTRLAIMSPLSLDVFLWTAAAMLEMHAPDPTAKIVFLTYQDRGVRTIRHHLKTNSVTEETIHAIFGLANLDHPVKFKSLEQMISEGKYGDFIPPLTELGGLHYFGQMHFSKRHADVAANLVKSRGGLQKLKLQMLAYGMQALDLHRSSRDGCAPRLDLCKPNKHILETQIPLHRSRLSKPHPVNHSFQILLLDIQAYLRQVELFLTSVAPVVSVETLVAWRYINQQQVLSLPQNEDQMFRLATLIFSYNVMCPMPYRNLVQGWVKELLPYLTKASDTSEDALWATTIAAIARPSSRILYQLQNTARRIVKALDLKEWYALKTVLIKYLWLDAACEKGGLKFWHALSDHNEGVEKF